MSSEVVFVIIDVDELDIIVVVVEVVVGSVTGISR